MGKPKLSKLRWRRMRNYVRATCFADGCDSLTQRYCKQPKCHQPYCDAHKGEHYLKAHTASKLVKRAGEIRLPGFAQLEHDRKIEVLALLAKVRACRRAQQSDIAQLKDGTFVAWAVVGQGLVEKRSERLEQALEELYLELRATR